jgi:hypothetical protein
MITEIRAIGAKNIFFNISQIKVPGSLMDNLSRLLVTH